MKKQLLNIYDHSIRNGLKIRNEYRDQLIHDYSPTIRMIAINVVSKVPANIEVDDLISVGTIGLMDAIDKYDPEKETRFKSYAEFRIKGSIIDELRNQDWLPRSVREKQKRVNRVCDKLVKKYGRTVTQKEIQKELGLSVEEFHKLLRDGHQPNILSLEDYAFSSRSKSKRTLRKEIYEDPQATPPDQIFQSKEMVSLLKNSLETLSDKHQIIISLYYFEDLSMKEISKIIELTEPRVCQMHKEALEILKTLLEEDELKAA